MRRRNGPLKRIRNWRPLKKLKQDVAAKIVTLVVAVAVATGIVVVLLVWALR